MVKNNNLCFILDDDPFYAELLSSHLSRYNLEIESYTNSSDCLLNIERAPFLLLLDFNLNEGGFSTGKEVFKKVKSIHPNIEIVIVSNQDSGQVVLDLIQSGVRNYIEKDENAFKNLDQILESIIQTNKNPQE